MDRFDLEGAGARVEVPWIDGPRMARGRGETLPLWQAGAYPKVRRPANAAKLMRATVGGRQKSTRTLGPSGSSASKSALVVSRGSMKPASAGRLTRTLSTERG